MAETTLSLSSEALLLLCCKVLPAVPPNSISVAQVSRVLLRCYCLFVCLLNQRTVGVVPDHLADILIGCKVLQKDRSEVLYKAVQNRTVAKVSYPSEDEEPLLVSSTRPKEEHRPVADMPGDLTATWNESKSPLGKRIVHNTPGAGVSLALKTHKRGIRVILYLESTPGTDLVQLIVPDIPQILLKLVELAFPEFDLHLFGYTFCQFDEDIEEHREGGILLDQDVASRAVDDLVVEILGPS